MRTGTLFNIFIFFFIGLLFSCTSKSINTPDQPINDLLVLALEKGDTNAYERLQIAYLDYAPREFLPIALKMANKYNYSKAYFDVYWAILYDNGVNYPGESLRKIDKKSKELAIDYLICGAKQGHNESIETLTDYFIKNSIDMQAFKTEKIRSNHGNYIDSLVNIIKLKNK